jgi:hypothetical protein
MDAKGWVSNSVISTFYIDGPIAANLTPTNGQSLVSEVHCR